MNHLINNRFLVLSLLVIVVGLFVMIVPVDNIFSIKDDGKNADKESITDSSPNSNKNKGCSPLDPRY